MPEEPTKELEEIGKGVDTLENKVADLALESAGLAERLEKATAELQEEMKEVGEKEEGN